MIARQMSSLILEAATQYPVVAVTGPRQSGKTTLCRELFPDYAYANLENPETRQFAQEDPNGFLAHFRRPAILDEVQRVPQLFSYLMPLVDEHRRMGEFVLSGSQNFHLQDAIEQSLAGRCATLKLLPFSFRELLGKPNHDILQLGKEEPDVPEHPESPFDHFLKGGYPPIYDRGIRPTNWYAQYTQSYLERDLRTLTHVGDLVTFERFLRLMAGRSGQILNMESLANDVGVSPPTVNRWLSLLVASYIVFLLRPHSRNFNKRLIKTPKLYFHDTGLLCYLLGIRTPKDLGISSFRGAVFETYVISELYKSSLNAGIEPPLYYWRDSQGHEVDLIIEDGETLFPVEIKSSQTISSSMMAGLDYWRTLNQSQDGMLVYGGADNYTRNGIQVRSWAAL